MPKPSRGKRRSNFEQKKPHFILDEHIEFKEYQKDLCRCASIERVPSKEPDPDILRMCAKKNYHLITRNYKDFRSNRSKFSNVGVIWIKAQNTERVVALLKKMLNKHSKHSYYHGKLIKIGKDFKVYDEADKLMKI